MIINAEIIEKNKDSQWTFGNKILYNMCKNNPGHTDANVVLGKVWLIGRSYSASLERRIMDKKKSIKKNIEWPDILNTEGDDFFKKASEKIVEQKIDDWFVKAADCALGSLESLEIHFRLCKLFYNMTGSMKRSLASKYLHFHFRDKFYIFDSRAQKAVRKILHDNNIADNQSSFNKSDGKYDREYFDFVIKCDCLRNYIKKELLPRKKELSPRQLDNILLSGDL